MDELFEKILYKAIDCHVTDIHFYLQNEVKVSMRRYGVLQSYVTLDIDEGGKLLNFIKYKSLIDLNYRLLPQTGRFKYTVEDKSYDLRVSYLPSKSFESIVIRILNNHKKFSLIDISPLEEIRDYLIKIVNKKNGLFIVSGSTGSGKSTTLYTLIDLFIEKGGLNIITIEDPVEMHKTGCIQIELNERGGITYHDTLKQILRHDPDVIVVGEVRDEITAKLCITCALTGHLVLTTLHAPNSLLTIKRLMNLDISKSDLESVLIGVLCQRIKYINNEKVLVLGELLNRKQVLNYLNKKTINYNNFLINSKILIEEKKLDKSIFMEEFNE